MKFIWLLIYFIFLIGSKFLLDIKYEAAVGYAYDLAGNQVPLSLISKYLTKDAFNNGRILFISVLFFLLTITLIKRKSITRLLSISFTGAKKGLGAIVETITSDYAKITKNNFLFIALPVIIIIFQLYQAWSRALQYDEAWSYNYHIGNSFISSFALPNNHILYTIVAYFFDKLPFKNEFAIRLPLIIAGFGSFVLCYHMLRQRFGIFVSWVSSLFFYSSCAITFYTLYARAYIFVIFFSLLFLLASYYWIKSNLTNKGALVWIFISFLFGVYSVPTSLYFFIPSFFIISYYALTINPLSLKSLAIGCTASVVIIAILFFPAFFSNHLNNLINSGNSGNQISLAFAKSYMFYNEEFHFGTRHLNGGLYILVVSVFSFLIYKKKGKDSFLFIISLSGLLMPFIFLAIQKIMLAERIMIHLVIYFTIFIAVVTHWIFLNTKLSKLKNKEFYILTVSGIIITANLIVASNHSWYTWSINDDNSLRKVASIMQEKDIDSLYLFPRYAKPAIHYYYKINSKKVSIMLNDPASIDYKPFDMNLDFEAILIEVEDINQLDKNKFELIFSDDIYALFKRRS